MCYDEEKKEVVYEEDELIARYVFSALPSRYVFDERIEKKEESRRIVEIWKCKCGTVFGTGYKEKEVIEKRKEKLIETLKYVDKLLEEVKNMTRINEENMTMRI